MKKLITIVMILALVAGFAFAADDEAASAAHGNSQINITAKIVAEAPAFELATSSGMDANVNDPTSSPVSPVTGVLGADNVTALGKGQSASVGFVINQIETARIKAGYKMTITVGDFELQSYSDNTTPAENYTLTDLEKFKTTTAEPTITASTDIKGTGDFANTVLADLENSNNILTVEYKGTVVAGDGASGHSAKVPLGTFTASWAGNAYAVSGNYMATVKMEVEAK